MSIRNFGRKMVLRERYDSNIYEARAVEHTTIYRMLKMYIDVVRPSCISSLICNRSRLQNLL